jgi:hypothetical protein
MAPLSKVLRLREGDAGAVTLRLPYRISVVDLSASLACGRTMTSEDPKTDSKQTKPWGVGDTLVAIVLAGLIALGGYLGYKTYVNLGGWRGELGLMGREVLQFGLVLLTFAGYVVCFFFIHLVISVVTGVSLRRIRVFISFKHDYEAIASAIEQGLACPAIRVIRIPFTSGRDHDEVIEESLSAVSRADAVIAVPGPGSSWMANELGLAAGTFKPIVVIKHLPDQTLSASLYRGYPVFAWDKIQGDFAPLRRFLVFAARSRADVLPQFGRCIAGFGGLAGGALIVWAVLSGLAKEAGRFVFAFASPHKAEVFIRYYAWGSFILFAAVFAIAFAFVLADRIRGLAAARQKIRTRDATFAEFQQVFAFFAADLKILDALEKEPLQPRHRDSDQAAAIIATT